MYSEIPPLFMYTNEPVKLILKSHSASRFMRSLTINFFATFLLRRIPTSPGSRFEAIIVYVFTEVWVATGLITHSYL